MAKHALDEALCSKVRFVLAGEQGVSERRMFGGLCFSVDGAMACGVVGDELMVRVGPSQYDDALSDPHARPMDFTGRELRGFVFVSRAGFRGEALAGWIARGVFGARNEPPKPRLKRVVSRKSAPRSAFIA